MTYLSCYLAAASLHVNRLINETVAKEQNSGSHLSVS